jgi:hypothetical protein
MEIFKKYSFGLCKLARSQSILAQIGREGVHSVGIFDANSYRASASKSKQYPWRNSINTVFEQ